MKFNIKKTLISPVRNGQGFLFFESTGTPKDKFSMNLVKSYFFYVFIALNQYFYELDRIDFGEIKKGKLLA